MDRWIVDSEPGGRFPAWTRGNAADVFPEPVSPLFVSLYLHDGMSQALRDAYIDIGVYDFDEIPNANGKDHPVLFGVFGGQVYNPLSFIRVFGARMPGASPDAIDKAFGAELTMKPDVDVEQPEGVSDVSVEEWSFFEVITEGNVFHGPLNRATAEEIEE